MKGLTISGEFGRLIARQKSSVNIEIGELLIAENKGSKLLLQVTDLQYASQVSQAILSLFQV